MMEAFGDKGFTLLSLLKTFSAGVRSVVIASTS